MKTIEQNGVKYICCKVPEGATGFKLFSKSKIIGFTANTTFGLCKRELPKEFSYELFSHFRDITESQAAELVEIVMGDEYKGYEGEWFNYLSAKKSLSSRIKSLGLNPDNTLIIKIK